ncbi:MAG TPA: GTPase [Pseudonocardiaceae bacterium]
MPGASTLLTRTRELAKAAVAVYAGSPSAEVVAGISRRLDEPLRVAIAGRVKAGKSTLLNGLIGQELAATDAGECTRIMTWFQNGLSYRVMLHPRQGSPRQLPFGGDGSLADLDLGGYAPEAVDRLVVDWPAQALRAMTLIDTPGMGSVDTQLSDRARAMLEPDGQHDSTADAVIYLMRHLHGDDVSFLETFRDTPGQGTPVNTVGVLARADEVGHSRPDALDSAQRIATRYRLDPRVRRLCHTVIPVAGLLACAAATLRESEYQIMARLAALPAEDRRRLFLSTDRFITLDTRGSVDPQTRIALVQRLGFFGVRSSVAMIGEGQVHHATELSRELLQLSGIEPLRELLISQFAARADALKARTAMLALDSVLQAAPPPTTELVRGLEEMRSGAHEFAEIRLVDALRDDPTLLPPEDGADAERLLGRDGADPLSRLGLPSDAGNAAIRAAVLGQLARWQRAAESPLAAREAKAAARILIRTCEGMLASVDASRAVAPPHVAR